MNAGAKADVSNYAEMTRWTTMGRCVMHSAPFKKRVKAANGLRGLLKC